MRYYFNDTTNSAVFVGENSGLIKDGPYGFQAVGREVYALTVTSAGQLSLHTLSNSPGSNVDYSLSAANTSVDIWLLTGNDHLAIMITDTGVGADYHKALAATAAGYSVVGKVGVPVPTTNVVKPVAISVAMIVVNGNYINIAVGRTSTKVVAAIGGDMASVSEQITEATGHICYIPANDVSTIREIANQAVTEAVVTQFLNDPDLINGVTNVAKQVAKDELDALQEIYSSI